jgi:Uma2 family endonuclease
MASLAHHYLTLEEFERQYGDRKPYHEYWFGGAIPKAMPVKLHGLLQKILMLLLDSIGFESIPELRVKISSDVQPLPDVIATSSSIPGDYPTEPFDVAIEILSPSDALQYVMRKCRVYSNWGIKQVFVFDPEDKTAYEWNHAKGSLTTIDALRFEGKQEISVEKIWAELDRRAKRLEQNA